MGSNEQLLKKELEELQKQLGKKQKFEDALSSLKSLLRLHYPSASPSLRKTVSLSFSLSPFIYLFIAKSNFSWAVAAVLFCCL
jgi:hypothetical protein